MQQAQSPCQAVVLVYRYSLIYLTHSLNFQKHALHWLAALLEVRTTCAVNRLTPTDIKSKLCGKSGWVKYWKWIP